MGVWRASNGGRRDASRRRASTKRQSAAATALTMGPAMTSILARTHQEPLTTPARTVTRNERDTCAPRKVQSDGNGHHTGR